MFNCLFTPSLKYLIDTPKSTHTHNTIFSTSTDDNSFLLMAQDKMFVILDSSVSLVSYLICQELLLDLLSNTLWYKIIYTTTTLIKAIFISGILQ